MTIRSRLLLLLLPALTALVAFIALFFYYNWSEEILNGFKTRLQSVVIATAQSIDPTEIEWISNHLADTSLKSSSRYQTYRKTLVHLKRQLPVDNLYIIRIEADPEEPGSYRQVFLLDASHLNESLTYSPGDTDYSETEEHRLYFTKKSFVTPIYESRKTKERFMSAYAPILNSQGSVIALLGADVTTKEIDRKLNNALIMIGIGAFVTVLMAVATVSIVAYRISKPVQQLNQAALDIAAGNYDADIHVKGPREIMELANTFNTMNECLVENMSRLKESSLIRERMYGEYECALLLQYYMLKKVVEDFNHPCLQMGLTSVNFANRMTGILLNVENHENRGLTLSLIEAESPGFEGLYELCKHGMLPIRNQKDFPFIECSFSHHATILRTRLSHLLPPLVWSMASQQFINSQNSEFTLSNRDMVFIYNSDLIDYFQTEERIASWLEKILRHFAEDGLDTIQTMLTNELTFLSKRETLKKNFQIVILQMKLPEEK